MIAAHGPSALSDVKPGLWELAGVPSAHGPTRTCFADVQQLLRYEHRNRSCSVKPLADANGSTVVDYSCGAAGFGRTRVDVITPRSLKINTQGISDRLPFNYTLNAHRIGDCAK